MQTNDNHELCSDKSVVDLIALLSQQWRRSERATAAPLKRNIDCDGSFRIETTNSERSSGFSHKREEDDFIF
eukprot:765988-Hanusia_phi.AAC.19